MEDVVTQQDGKVPAMQNLKAKTDILPFDYSVPANGKCGHVVLRYCLSLAILTTLEAIDSRLEARRVLRSKATLSAAQEALTTGGLQ